MTDKLIIQKAGTDATSEVMVRVSKKANLLIEYAFDRTVVTDKEV